MPTHLEDYLAYYKKCDFPGYAVLVTGEWGTGKTYQVKDALAENEIYYVSLFGLQSADEAHSAVLAAMDPTLSEAKNIISHLGKTAREMGGIFALGGLIPRVMNNSLLKKVATDRTLVFDDLERSGINLRDTLGVINMYVEHYGCRVVVIAHDEKLVVRFHNEKEKIFGQTIKIEPNIAKAYSNFCSALRIREECNFLNRYKTDIVSLFEVSGVKSLRVLRHLIEDLARLYKTLDDRHVANDGAMAELVSLFSVLNMEVRGGELFEQDLIGRSQFRGRYEQKRHAKNGAKPDKPKFLVADEKYTSVDLSSNLLQDEAIVRMLIKGQYDKQIIHKSLNNSAYFIQPQDTPPWKVFLRFDELEDDVVQRAVEQMQDQFDNRTITVSGEMLHVFSLRLLMSEEGILNDDLPTVVKTCKAYVDDLLAKKQLPPRETNWRWSHSFDTGYEGYTYWISDATRAYFNEILDHLIASREKALEEQFPAIKQDLMRLIQTDGPAFFEQVCNTHKGNNPYALVPILRHIPPKEFVDAWMATPKQNWPWVYRALRERYRGPQSVNELKSETEWVQQIVDLLDEEAGKVRGFRALRLKRAVPPELRALNEE